MEKLKTILSSYKPGVDDVAIFDSIITNYKITKKDLEYIKKRDAMNKIVSITANQVLEEIRKLYKYKTIEFMSSFTARTNLAELKDMDVDIGVFIPKISLAKINKVFEIAKANGFKCNPNIVVNQYYSCEKIINGVEIELKFRDNDNTSHAILELHHKLDNLNFDVQNKITMIKYKLKQLDNKKYYTIFKALMFNAVFTGIKNNYLFQLVQTGGR
jgi:hypothetical protein